MRHQQLYGQCHGTFFTNVTDFEIFCFHMQENCCTSCPQIQGCFNKSCSSASSVESSSQGANAAHLLRACQVPVAKQLAHSLQAKIKRVNEVTTTKRWLQKHHLQPFLQKGKHKRLRHGGKYLWTKWESANGDAEQTTFLHSSPGRVYRDTPPTLLCQRS